MGRKIGLTAKAVQQQLGVDRPDFGVLFQDMQIADGGILEPAEVIQPKVEAEVALIFARDLDKPDATAEDVFAAVKALFPPLRLLTAGSLIGRSRSRTPWRTMAPPRFSFSVRRESHYPDSTSTPACGMALEVNGAIASLGAGAACLGHPLNAAAWLARTLAERREPLKAGDIVLTGALGPMVPLTRGSHIKATIGGLGSVNFHFAGG